jgi:predicted alpha/beta superfamily hydrolase
MPAAPRQHGKLLLSSGMLETHDIPSGHLGTTRRVTVWLPSRPRADRPGPYPVLYLNDGQNLFDPARAFAGQTWRVADTAMWLVRTRRIPPLVIVGVDHGGERRAQEYLPVRDDRHPTQDPPLGRQYARFLTRELLPFIARHYPVAEGARHTGLGGSSYGAVAALNTTLSEPGVFGNLLLESPSLYVGGGYLLRKARTAERWPSRIYLGVGTKETSNPDVNQETVANVLTLERVLRRAGLGPKRLRVVVEPGATHSEGAWAGRLADALQFLYGSRTSRR